MSQTIILEENTTKKFSKTQLEKFINSSDFEDIVLGYQMLQGQTGKTESYEDFKTGLGLS